MGAGAIRRGPKQSLDWATESTERDPMLQSVEASLTWLKLEVSLKVQQCPVAGQAGYHGFWSPKSLAVCTGEACWSPSPDCFLCCSGVLRS